MPTMVHLAGALSFAGISDAEGTHGPSSMTGELPKAHVGSLHITLSLGSCTEPSLDHTQAVFEKCEDVTSEQLANVFQALP